MDTTPAPTTTARPVSPETWGATLRQTPVLAGERVDRRSGLVRRWTGGDVHMSQPPLDHHYVVLHLGGPKRVTRTGDGRTVSADVPEGALTLVPAGVRYEWETRGPIDFAHLYVHPARLNTAIASGFDRDPSGVRLDDVVGVVDPVLSQVIRELLDEAAAQSPAPSPYAEALFDLALMNLVRKHSSLGPATPPARHALAPVRLRRVLDLVEASLGEPLSLGRLAATAGLSRFHFSRAFANAMGEPPLAYVARRRLAAAKRLLREGEAPLAEVARRSGYGSPSRFSATFRRRTGMTPSDFRRQL